MCLYTKQICPIKARKDIVCYKVFATYYQVCKTPTVGYVIPDPHYTGEPFLMDDSDKDMPTCRHLIPTLYGFRITSIGRGMIHACINMKYAKSARVSFWKHLRLNVYECIIPKGTLYFKGLDGDICSRKLLVVKRVVD